MAATEAQKAAVRAYYARNKNDEEYKKKLTAKNKAWREKNKEKIEIANAARRAATQAKREARSAETEALKSAEKEARAQARAAKKAAFIGDAGSYQQAWYRKNSEKISAKGREKRAKLNPGYTDWLNERRKAKLVKKAVKECARMDACIARESKVKTPRIKKTPDQKRLEVNAYQREYLKNNPQKAAVKKMKKRERMRAYFQTEEGKVWRREYAKRYRAKLPDSILADRLRMSVSELRQYPQLAEAKRLNLLIKRELKEISA